MEPAEIIAAHFTETRLVELVHNGKYPVNGLTYRARKWFVCGFVAFRHCLLTPKSLPGHTVLWQRAVGGMITP